MKASFSRFCAFAILLLVSCSAVGQVSTGTTPLGSFSSGPDVINLGNLNVHFAIPVFTKPGRGMPFFYNLGYESSVWYPLSSSGTQHWQPVANWGWRGQTDAAVGYVSVSSAIWQCWSIDDGRLERYTVWTYNNYVDEFGTPHPINAMVSNLKEVTNCEADGVTSVQETVTDGSGLNITVSTGSPTKVVQRDGTTIYPAGAVGAYSASTTDRNGNQITTNGSSFTDTMGMTALSMSGGAPNPLNFTYTDSSVHPQSVAMNYSTYTVQTNFGCSGISEYGPASASLVSSVVLPDGSSYSFTYEQTPNGPAGNVTGRVKTITLRTGGTITYTYSGGNNGIICADGSTAGFTRATSDGTTTYARSGSGTAWTTTITDPQSNQTVVNFQTVVPSGGTIANFFETHRTVNQGASTWLAKTDTCYNGATPDCTATAIAWPITRIKGFVTLNNNQQSLTDSTLNSAGLPTEVDEYDFGNPVPSTPMRKTQINYAGYLGSIVDRPGGIIVYDGAGVQKAATNLSYDETSVAATSGVPQHVAAPGPRGNLTSINRWLNTTGAFLATTLTYDDTGNVLTSTDPGGHQTQFSYTDNFSDGTNRNSLAYVTQVTLPATAVQHVTKSQYDANTGLPVKAWDQNNQQTTTTYDAMLRPLVVSSPDGGSTSFFYWNPNQTDVQRKMTSSANAYSATLYDSYGRVSRFAQENGEASPWDQQDFCYDSNGRLSFQSYPYQGIGWGHAKVCSGAGDSFSYDALGRTTQLTHSDGSSSTTSYTGRATQITDEGNGGSSVSRVLQKDGLGRMTSVCELSSATLLGSSNTPTPCGLDIGATGFLTSYSYDTLNNLTTVTQGLVSRTYGYDSLSRMTSETEPEAGTVTYTYNADSLLATRVRPAPNQSSASVTTTTNYSYDALHRLLSRTYSGDPSGTPSANFLYDTDPGWTNPPATNVIGRLSESYTSPLVGAEIFGYDSMGRVIMNNQCTPRNCGTSNWPVGYTYNFLGDVTSASNGVGVTFNYAYNIAGRLTQLTTPFSDANHPDTLLSGAHYTPTAITDVLGNGVAETTSFSARGLLQSQQALLPGGQPATASVSVSGGIAPAGVLPAAGRALAGYRNTIAGTDQVFYLGSDQHVHQLYWQPSVGWNNADVTVMAGAPNAASGSALHGHIDTIVNGDEVLYLGSDQHVHSLYWFASVGWNNADMTALTGAPNAASNSELIGYVNTVANSDEIFYLGSDQHVHELYWYAGTGWNNADVTVMAGAPNAASGSALHGHINTLANSDEVFYLGSDQHVHQLYWQSGIGWKNADVTVMAGAPNAASGSALAGFIDTANNADLIFYVGSDQHVHELNWYAGIGWATYDLSAPDAGTVSLNIGPFTATACFGQSTNSACTGQPVNSTAADVASALAAAINVSASPASATVSGGTTINLTWKAAGPFTVAVSALSTSHDQPNVFSSPSFTTPATNFGGGGSGGPAYSFTLGQAADGQITSANDLVNGNWTFSYDAFNRLVTSNKNSGAQAFTYDYDRYGNRWHQNVTQGQGSAPQYTFDNNNHLVGSSVTYDALGEVTNDGFHSYTYDAEGRLLTVDGGTTATYVYDAEGRRVRGPSQDYLYDLAGHAVTMIQLGGAYDGVWSFTDIYAGGRHLATYSGGTTNFLHADWLGTKRVMTGVNAAVSQTCTGLPFGDGVTCTPTTNWTYNGFTDDIHDSESNLEHTLFRQLSGTQGRWITPDPYLGSMDLTNPQSLNRYAYVLGNPMNAIDPLGLFCSWELHIFDTCGMGDGSAGAALCMFVRHGTPGGPGEGPGFWWEAVGSCGSDGGGVGGGGRGRRGGGGGNRAQPDKKAACAQAKSELSKVWNDPVANAEATQDLKDLGKSMLAGAAIGCVVGAVSEEFGAVAVGTIAAGPAGGAAAGVANVGTPLWVGACAVDGVAGALTASGVHYLTHIPQMIDAIKQNARLAAAAAKVVQACK